MKPIKETLKDVKFTASYKDGQLRIVSDSPNEGEQVFEFNLNSEEGADDNDYWNTIKIEGKLYDVNLWLNEDEYRLALYGVQDDKMEANNSMTIPMEGQPTEEEKKEFLKSSVIGFLIELFEQLNMDRPENFDNIVDFIVNDVTETADSDYFSYGDITIGFRRFLESVTKND